MFAKERTSSRPSSRSAHGATLKPPPKMRALATTTISISRRPKGTTVGLRLHARSPLYEAELTKRAVEVEKTPLEVAHVPGVFENGHVVAEARRCSGSACPRSSPRRWRGWSPSRMIRQHPWTSRWGNARATWRDRSRCRPAPGPAPPRRPCPSPGSPLPTLPQVPSPPTATIRPKPRSRAFAREPGLVTRGPGSGRARPRPHPRRQLLEDRRHELGAAALAGVRVEDDEDPVVHSGPATPAFAFAAAARRCRSRLELTERVEELVALAHPHLAERLLEDLGDHRCPC